MQSPAQGSLPPWRRDSPSCRHPASWVCSASGWPGHNVARPQTVAQKGRRPSRRKGGLASACLRLSLPGWGPQASPWPC